MIDMAPLEREHGGDDLKIVGHAVLQFVEQQFAVFGQGAAAFPLYRQFEVRLLQQVDQRDVHHHHGAVEDQRQQHARMKIERHARRNEEIPGDEAAQHRSEEHTSELQSLMRISYAVFCLKKKKQK